MAWKNIARMLGDIAPDTGDRGLFLALHTGAPATKDNELNPREHSGYDRLKATLNIGRHGLSDTAEQWAGKLNSTNALCWGNTGFVNRGSTAWPAVRAASISSGPEASVPGSAPSFIVADRTLAQPWMLGAGNNGYPTDDLVDFGVDKPDTANDDVFFWSRETSNGDFITFLNMFFANLDSYYSRTPGDGSYDGINRSSWGDRRNVPRGIAQVPLFVELANTLPALGAEFSEWSPLSSASPGGVPIGLDAQGTALINLQAIDLNANTPVSASDVSGGLYWFISMFRSTNYFSGSSALSTGTLSSNLYFLAGKLATDNPALALGEGVIPAGAIRIVM